MKIFRVLVLFLSAVLTSCGTSASSEAPVRIQLPPENFDHALIDASSYVDSSVLTEQERISLAAERKHSSNIGAWVVTLDPSALETGVVSIAMPTGTTLRMMGSRIELQNSTPPPAPLYYGWISSEADALLSTNGTDVYGFFRHAGMQYRIQRMLPPSRLFLLTEPNPNARPMRD